MYEYMWGHTAAQIELIDIDQPLTVYKKQDAKGGLKPGDKGYVPDARKLEDAVRKWKDRKAKREEKGFSLSRFLGTDDKAPKQ